MPYTLTKLYQLNYDVIMCILRNSCHYNFMKNFVWTLFSIEKQVQELHLKRVEHFCAQVTSYNPCLMWVYHSKQYYWTGSSFRTRPALVATTSCSGRLARTIDYHKNVLNVSTGCELRFVKCCKRLQIPLETPERITLRSQNIHMSAEAN